MRLGFDRPDLLWLLVLWLPMVALAWTSRRKLSPRRWVGALLLRTVVWLALVFALAELNLRRAVDDLAVVFVLDRSASVGAEGRQEAVDFVRAALEHQRPNDRAAVVVFGAEAMVDKELQDHLELVDVESVPSPHHSDLAAGLRLGTALLPADRTRRVVVLTDGEQTRGDAGAQVLLTASDDLRVAAVHVGGSQGPEVLLEDILMSAEADAGQAFEVRVVARSEADVEGSLLLYRNDVYLGETKVKLAAGRSQIVPFKQQLSQAGLYRYRAVLDVDEAADTRPENNQVMGSVQVRGRPRLLVVERSPGTAEHLVRALGQQSLDVEVVGPDRLPGTLAGLRPYAGVFLVDIGAFVTTVRQQQALQAYVRDLGRGLVMVGGDQSFGVGGWYRTPVEEALPVRMDIEDKTRFPALAMVLAIDKSCSMGGGGQNTALGLAKEAALQTADLLSERDSLGVISFDGASSWISPLAPLTDRQRVYDDVGALRPGGGTVVFAALQEAIRALRASDAALKHVIVLSDGIIGGEDPIPMISQARADGITLTGIAVGGSSDRATMERYATAGGGNHYIVTDTQAIPAIFTRETMLASRSFLVEEPFAPRRADSSPLTRGLGQLPTLGGYVATEPRPRSTVPLVVPAEGDQKPLPLLAHGRYGLGRSVAWTSDVTGRWSKGFLSTPDFVRLWTQVARFVAADGAGDDVVVDSEIRDGELVITVDAFDGAGGFRNFLDGEARVVAPDLQVHPLPLRQVAPGRYEARHAVDQDGAWLVGVELRDGETSVGSGVSEAVQPYSPEFRRSRGGKALVEEIGRVGGGGVLTDPASAFARPDVPRMVPRPLWPMLLWLAGFLWLLDVAARRVQIGFDPRAQALAQPVGAGPRFRWERRPPPAAPAGPRSEGAPVDELPLPGDAPEPVDVPEDSYAGRLLAARRKARDKHDK